MQTDGTAYIHPLEAKVFAGEMYIHSSTGEFWNGVPVWSIMRPEIPARCSRMRLGSTFLSRNSADKANRPAQVGISRTWQPIGKELRF